MEQKWNEVLADEPTPVPCVYCKKPVSYRFTFLILATFRENLEAN